MKKNLNLFTYLYIFVILSFFSVSCKVPDPIIYLDTNQINRIDLKIQSAPSSWPILGDTVSYEKDDACDTDAYVFFAGLIDNLERDYFECRRDRIPLKTPNDQVATLKDELQIQLTTIATGSSDEEAQTYSLHIDTGNNKAYITNSLHSYELNDQTVQRLLNSSILPLSKTLTYSGPDFVLSQDQEFLSIHGQITEVTSVIEERQVSFKKVYTDYDSSRIPSDLSLTGLISGDETLVLTNLSITYTPLDFTWDDLASKDKTALTKANISWSIKDSTLDHGLIIIDEEGLKRLEFYPPPIDGSYRLDILFDYTSNTEDRNNSGTGRVSSYIEVTSQADFTLNQESYMPGDLIVITGHGLSKPETLSLDTNIYNLGVTFLPDGSNHYLLLPIMSKTTPGEYYVTIMDETGSAIKTLIIPVIEKEFATQYLETSSSTESLRNDAAYDQLNEAFARGRDGLSLSKLWEGPFIQPVIGGRISTEYGEIRYTNDNIVASRHSGIDFALPTGTPVYATQNGIVTLAEELTITGNTLFIDHGFGLISQCYHLDKIYVEAGQEVKAGDLVAEIGTTGYSTGPHLHFSMYFSGVYINPWNFFDNQPF